MSLYPGVISAANHLSLTAEEARPSAERHREDMSVEQQGESTISVTVCLEAKRGKAGWEKQSCQATPSTHQMNSANVLYVFSIIL